MKPEITERERTVMQHALGFPDPSSGRNKRSGWRNRFYTNVSGPDGAVWEALVAKGLAVSRPAEDGEMRWYHVSKAGCELLGMHEDEIIDACGTPDEVRAMESRRREREQKHLALLARRRERYRLRRDMDTEGGDV